MQSLFPLAVTAVLVLAVYGYPTKNDSAQTIKEGSRSKRNTKDDYTTLWENGIVYYESHLPKNELRYFRMNMDYISSQTCVQFVEDRSKPYKTKLIPSDKTNKTCGGSTGGQKMNAETTVNCYGDSTTIHELFHLLGIAHTHERKDWKEFIRPYNNSKVSSGNYRGIPFDYGSAMIYKDKVPLDRRYELTVYVQTKVSFYDFLSVNKIYCTDICPSDDDCMNGGYSNPNDCSICNCPIGFSGTKCELKGTVCGETLQAEKEWKTSTAGFTKDATEPHKNFFGHRYCDTWIKAPNISNAVLEVELMSTVKGTLLELVIDEDVRQSGAMYHNIVDPVLLSTKKSLLPMRVYNEADGPYFGQQTYVDTKVVFRYRYVFSEEDSTPTQPEASNKIPSSSTN